MNEKGNLLYVCSDRTLSRHICKNALDATDQPPSDCLNTFQARACVWDGPCGILPRQLNRSTGPISCLNRKRLTPYGRRNMTGLASADARARAARGQKTSRPTDRENERALNGGCQGSGKGRDGTTLKSLETVPIESESQADSIRYAGSNPARNHHSEPSGFLFPFHFMSDNSHMRRPRVALLFLGGSLLFSAFPFSFNLPLSTQQYSN